MRERDGQGEDEEDRASSSNDSGIGQVRHGLRQLALDGTCDIVRRLAWPPVDHGSGEDGEGEGGGGGGEQELEQEQDDEEEEEEEQNNDDEDEQDTEDYEDSLLQQTSMAWDKASTERCLGWPVELVDSSFEWWTSRIHPEDRQRVVASFKRSLFESDTARYWSESYRLRTYDGSALASQGRHHHQHRLPPPPPPRRPSLSSSFSSTSTPSFFDLPARRSELQSRQEEQEEEDEKTPDTKQPQQVQHTDSSDTASLLHLTPLYSASSSISGSTETLHEEGGGGSSRHRFHHASSSPSNSTGSPTPSPTVMLLQHGGGGGQQRQGQDGHVPSAASSSHSNKHHPPHLSTSSPNSSSSFSSASYVTVLDQVYITRQALRPSQHTQQQPAKAKGKGKEEQEQESSRPPATEVVDNATAVSQGSSTVTPPSRTRTQARSQRRPRPRPRARPIHAIGSIFALEQKVKTSEALHNPRSQLLRNISGISTTSTTSNASAATGSGSSASFASATSSMGGMGMGMGVGGFTNNPYYIGGNSNFNSPPPVSSGGPALYSYPSTSGSAYSPSSYSPGTGKAFSFLDVEGVRTVLENTQSGLIMIDQYSRPTYLNAAGAAMTGYSSLDDLRSTGKTLHSALHYKRADGSDYPTDDCPILKSIATLTRETNHADTFWRKDGTPFPVMWSCSPISKLGRSIGAVLEFRDVTEEKALEKDKLKAILMTKHQEITIKEANASKQRMTQFLDYIAHELRNPLHGIAANIEFLRDSLTALQATFTSERPSLSPLQTMRDSQTPTASGSGLSTSSQSSLLYSSSAGSSASSLSAAGGMRARSPQLAITSPSAITSAALTSAIVPARDISPPKAEMTAVGSSPPKMEKSSSLVTSNLSTSPKDVSGRASLKDRSLATIGSSRPSLPAFEGSLTGPGVKRLDEHVSQLSSILPHAVPGTPKGRTVGPSSSDEQVNKQFQSHFERAPGGAAVLPPWQAEDKKSENAHMTMSPLLADITKHAATNKPTAALQGEGHKRKGSHNLSAQQGQTQSPGQGALPSHSALLPSRGTSQDRLRDEESSRRLPPASPSPSATTVVASEADNDSARLSTLEVQQVLQTSQSFITSIRECVFHATHITNNVLDLSRFEAGKVELLNDIVFPARVATLAVDMMMARAQEKDIELGLDIPQDQTLVRGDGTRLAQVFLNLLSNAIKFTPRGGKVTLRFRISTEGSRVMLTGAISDTGMGMSRAEMSNLFQRFGQSSRAIQAEYGGTGLGLSICQEIVSLQGGKMSVDSEKGKGSTFSFTAYYQPASEDDVNEYLRKTPGQNSRRGSISPTPSPTSESGDAASKAAVNAFIPTISASITGQPTITSLPEAQQTRLKELKKQFEAEQAQQEPFKFKHILVAEDNGINQNIMKTYLKKLGYNFTIVSNGQEVLDTFVNKPQEVPIDVILMDCEMPVMDGRQATEHIRQHEHFRKNLVTPLDSPFNLQLGAVEINSLQSTPPAGTPTVSHYSPPLTSPAQSHSSSPGLARKLHRTPIIGLSGNARQELVQQALSSGMDDYVAKPFKLAELEKVLKKWEATIDEQLIHRAIAIKAKEFMAANAAAAASPLKPKKLGSSSGEEYQFPWASGKGGAGGMRSDSSPADSLLRSPTKVSASRPTRPPLVSSMSASRLPREHLVSYAGSAERARPKLPSRLSNEWVRQAPNASEENSFQAVVTSTEQGQFGAASGPLQSAPSGMSPVIESPTLTPQPETSQIKAARAFPLPVVRPSLDSRRSTSDPSHSHGSFRRSL